MKTGMEIIRTRAAERGIVLADDSIPEETFVALGLPMVVQCRGCFETMGLPSAYVDDDNFTYCGTPVCNGQEEL